MGRHELHATTADDGSSATSPAVSGQFNCLYTNSLPLRRADLPAFASYFFSAFLLLSWVSRLGFSSEPGVRVASIPSLTRLFCSDKSNCLLGFLLPSVIKPLLLPFFSKSGLFLFLFSFLFLGCRSTEMVLILQMGARKIVFQLLNGNGLLLFFISLVYLIFIISFLILSFS